VSETYNANINPKPGTIIVSCSDPRIRTAIRRFVEEKLKLAQGEFVPINVAGGAAALAHRTKRPGDFFYIRDQIEFFCGHFTSIKRVVIIGHQDCGYYKTILNHPDKDDREKKDLPRAAEVITREIPGVTVDCYYARFLDESHAEIVFEMVQ